MAMPDASRFFAAFKRAGMIKTVSWTPSSGGDTQTPDVLFDMPDGDIFGGEQVSTDYAITYAATDLIGLRAQETLTIDGTDYLVREKPRKLDDGAMLTVKLSKV